MKYLQERERQERRSRTTGVALTAVLHAGLAGCLFMTGFTYLDPPPPEKETILIEFDEPEIEKPRQIWNGTRPQAVNPDPTQPINLVQQSEAQNEGTKSNEAPEAQVDEFGDVDIKDPAPKKAIDRRALFRAADNKTQKDTLAAQTARKASDALKAGHAQGNTLTGETSGQPNAKLEGRELRGTIPKPQYNVQKAGRVVVTISVDRNGDVITAQPGAEGTNVTDKELWQAARKAALGTHFNIKADAPEKQYGTITYIFSLE
jgi:hypothetical protein